MINNIFTKSVILSHNRASLVPNRPERNSSWGKFRHALKGPARLSAGGRICGPPPRSLFPGLSDGNDVRFISTSLIWNWAQRCFCWFCWCSSARLYWDNWKSPSLQTTWT